MGKHVERAMGEDKVNNNKQVHVKLKKVKEFNELVERVNDIEFAVKDITDKLTNLQIIELDKTKDEGEDK